jgi:transcriptional regulator with XRE-family HTH domain
MTVEIDRILALRLIAVRKSQRLTIDDVSERSGVSRATLSRIERAETSPTANVLGQLCSVYRLTMSQLLLSVEQDIPKLTKWDEAPIWQDPETSYKRTTLSPPTNGYDIEIMHGELPAGAFIEYKEPPISGLEQHIHVLEGQLNLTFNSQQYVLFVSDTLRLKLSGASIFSNITNIPAKYLLVNKSI